MPGVPPRVAFLSMAGALWLAAASLAAEAESQRIRGTVTLPDGRPAAGADIWLIDTEWLSTTENGETSRSRIQEASKSDAGGQFSFKSLPPEEDFRGHLAVLARDPTGRLGWVTSYAHPNWGDLRVALHDGGEFTGRALDEAGVPLNGVSIEATMFDSSRIYHAGLSEYVGLPAELKRNYEATTSANGSFTIRGLPRQGSLIARVTRPGEAPQRILWNLDRPVELRLEKAGAIAVHLTADDPQAAANREVGFRLADDSPGNAPYRVIANATVQTDLEGNVRVEGLPPGDYEIGVAPDPLGPRWYAANRSSAKVAAGQTAEVAIGLTAGVAVAGTVVDAETKRGLPNLEVGIANLEGNAILEYVRVTTDAEGRYAGFVKPGQVYITVKQTPDVYSLPPQATKAETGEQRSVQLPPIALARSIPVEGIVRDASGKPVAGALVYVTAAPPFGDRLRREVLTTDENGRFKVAGLPADDGFTLHAYTETAVSDGGWLVVPNKQQGDVELQVKPELGFRLRGRVVDERGQPMADIPVRLMWGRGYFSRHSEMSGVSSPLPPVVTGADGRFESRLLWPQDRYTARIFVPGHQITEVPGGSSDQQWVGSPPDTLNVPDIVLKKQE